MRDGSIILGAFGKIPVRGDFFKRRLPGSFVNPWDAWLGAALAASRDELGAGWLDAFLTAPIWRFVLASGVCGDAVAAGVLMPSVDAVNRHFPLTFAAVVPVSCSPFAVAAAEAWFAQLEELGLACLAQRLDPETIEGRLDAIGEPHVAPAPRAFFAAETADPSAAERCSWPYDPAVPGFLLECFYPAALDDFTRRAVGAYSLWWTTGSEAIEPAIHLFRGLPPERAFARLLTGERATPPANRAILSDDTGYGTSHGA
jgi:type VI secretion system protein ImpM